VLSIDRRLRRSQRWSTLGDEIGIAMNGPRQPQRAQAKKGKTPAERSEEFTATQRQLKQEAADRREAAKAPADGDEKNDA
jgi:hypothetical protein